MKILKKLFGQSDVKIHVDEIATKVNGVKRLLSFAIISDFNISSTDSFVKFGNGFMICWMKFSAPTAIQSTFGSLFSTGSMVKSFPQEFIEAPSVSRDVFGGTPYTWATIGGQGTTNKDISVMVVGSQKDIAVPIISVIAFGRYKE